MIFAKHFAAILALGAAAAFAQPAADPAAQAAEPAWGQRALFVEREAAPGQWSPWTAVPLSTPSSRAPSSRGGPEFAVWHEGPRRRVEIWCGDSSIAWERLIPGASAQLEFDCLGARYRAQAGLASASAAGWASPAPAPSKDPAPVPMDPPSAPPPSAPARPAALPPWSSDRLQDGAGGGDVH